MAKIFIYRKNGKGTYHEMRMKALVHQQNGCTARIKKDEEHGFYIQLTFEA